MTTVTVTAQVTKRCPYRDERDDGTVVLTFDVADHQDAPELHALSDHLGSWRDQAISHEAFTRDVVQQTGATSARSRWTTAGMEVSVDVPHRSR